MPSLWSCSITISVTKFGCILDEFHLLPNVQAWSWEMLSTFRSRWSQWETSLLIPLSIYPEMCEDIPHADSVLEKQDIVWGNLLRIYPRAHWNFTWGKSAHVKQRQTTARLYERIHQSSLHENPETTFCPNLSGEWLTTIERNNPPTRRAMPNCMGLSSCENTK